MNGNEASHAIKKMPRHTEDNQEIRQSRTAIKESRNRGRRRSSRPTPYVLVAIVASGFAALRRLSRPPPISASVVLIRSRRRTVAADLEVWTLCRIFKRNLSHRKCTPDWREVSAKRNPMDASSKTCSVESDSHESYIDFRSAPAGTRHNEKKNVVNHAGETNQMLRGQFSSASQAPSAGSYSNFFSPDVNDQFIKYGDWDELGSVVEFAADPFLV
ncbi:hypothetical protein U1Q18_000124 [Sarracenia purpurea var. burkii]